MQDVHTASSSCNSIFAFPALRPRPAPAPEGRWYTCGADGSLAPPPRLLVVVHNTTNSASPR